MSFLWPRQKRLVCPHWLCTPDTATGSRKPGTIWNIVPKLIDMCNRKAVKNFDSMKVKDLLKALERVDPEASEDNTKGKLYFISSDIQSVVAKKTSKQTKSDAIQQAIINDFIRHRVSSLTEVADRLKGVASYHTIRKYINKLEEDGQIITSGKRRWMKYVWSGPESIL